MRDSNKTGMVNPYLVLPWKRMTKTEGISNPSEESRQDEYARYAFGL